MRTIDIPTIKLGDLVHVTGGCHKQAPPPPQGGTGSPSVDVTVATGAQGGQMIQQALQSF